MKINNFAKRLGLPTSKIRYYENIGLIKGNRQEKNNYRDFKNEDALEVYSSLMLRSYGMGIQECFDAKEENIEEINSWIEKYIEKTKQEIKRQEMLLLRLRTIESYSEMFRIDPNQIHIRYLSEPYEIWTFGNNIKLTKQHYKDIEILVNSMPYSYACIKVSKESILAEGEDLDVSIGIGILKESVDLLNIKISSASVRREGNILEQLFEMEDPFQIKKSDLTPLLTKIKELNLELTDLIGRVYVCYEKDGKTVYGFGLVIML